MTSVAKSPSKAKLAYLKITQLSQDLDSRKIVEMTG